MDITIIGTGNMARGIATRARRGRLRHAAGHRDRQGTGPGGRAVRRRAGRPRRRPAHRRRRGARRLVPRGRRRPGPLPPSSTARSWSTSPTRSTSSRFEPLTLDAGSAAQEIAAKAPGAKVVKAFNTTFAGTLGEGRVAGEPLDVLIASDDDDAKAVVSRIVTAAGLRPIDAGPLKRARELEALGYLHMVVQEPLGTGYGSTVKLLA